MASPGDPTYRHDISDTLTLRWSTSADRAGCAFLACLAPGMDEGQESEFGVQYFEPYTDDAFYAGNSLNWALCVDRSRPFKHQPDPSDDSKYLAAMRKEMIDAQEHVVALVYYVPSELSLEGASSTINIGKAQIVACRSTYRGGRSGVNIMKGLFEMVHDRALLDGATVMLTSGIPAYYRTHGYEYALTLGRPCKTYISTLSPDKTSISSSSPYRMRRANIQDLPALIDLVNATRPVAALFPGPGPAMLSKQLQWMLGARDARLTKLPMYTTAAPFFLLEKLSPDGTTQIVCAAGAQTAPSTSLSIDPLLWDGKESAIDVVTAMIQYLVQESANENGDHNKLSAISWIVAEAHPLRRWLIASQSAIAAPPSSLYDSNSNFWINILSLPQFINSTRAALDVRLRRAASIIGQNYSAELRIAELRQTVRGVIIKIINAQVAMVEDDKLSETDIKPSAFMRGGPNISLPHGCLVQLLMGYRSWEELCTSTPDVMADPALAPLIDILFPKMSIASSVYF